MVAADGDGGIVISVGVRKASESIWQRSRFALGCPQKILDNSFPPTMLFVFIRRYLRAYEYTYGDADVAETTYEYNFKRRVTKVFEMTISVPATETALCIRTRDRRGNCVGQFVFVGSM